MKKFTYQFENGPLTLTEDQVAHIADDYLRTLYRRAADEAVEKYAENPEIFSAEDIEEIGDNVYQYIADTELLFDNLECYLWTEAVSEKEERIKARNQE